jgi:hypothetical protein
MLCAVAATLVAAFFLYDPIYILYVSNPLEIGDLIIFAGYRTDRSEVHR